MSIVNSFQILEFVIKNDNAYCSRNKLHDKKKTATYIVAWPRKQLVSSTEITLLIATKTSAAPSTSR